MSKTTIEDNMQDVINFQDGYKTGWNEALSAIENEFMTVAQRCFDRYENDPKNYPKPNFLSAIALIVTATHKLKKE